MSIEAADHEGLFVGHAFEEHTADLGEVRMNYVVEGDPSSPALVLIPAQAESWWGYEPVIPLLAERFRVFAVDLRGQGRSTWTPGRYTLDLFGGDLVRFLDRIVRRPAIVSGLSSGGTVAAWLAAYAIPGQVAAALLEDPPLFSSQTTPACGPSIHQGIGPLFALWNKWLGDQWSIGDWNGMRAAQARELPDSVRRADEVMHRGAPAPEPTEVPQNLREYDPEWGRAFVSGVATASSDHVGMLSRITAPVLLTHHWHEEDEATGALLGSYSDLQARRARSLMEEAGSVVTYRRLPEMPHSMHGSDPERFVKVLLDWYERL